MLEIYLGVAGLFGLVIFILIVFVDFSPVSDSDISVNPTQTKERARWVIEPSIKGPSVVALLLVSLTLIWRFVRAYRHRLLSPEAFY